MRRFLVEVVLDAAIVFVILFVLSLISVQQPFPFGSERSPIIERTASGILPYLLAGLAIGIVDRLVRPLIVALTGRLVLSTMGLFLIVVNAISLWIATLIIPDIAVAASPKLLWFLLASALFTAAVLHRGCRLRAERAARGRPGRRSLDLALPRRAADAAAEPDPREHPPPTGLRHHLPLRSGHRPRAVARRVDAELVPAQGPGTDALGGAVHPRDAGPADAPAAWPHLREDRPDGGEPPRGPAAGARVRAREAPERCRAVPLGAGRGHPRGGTRSAGRRGVRDDRPRAVRGGIDGAGPSRDAPGRSRRRGEDPATEHHGEGEGGPRRPRGTRQGRGTAIRARAQARCPGHDPRVRDRRDQGARLPQRGVPRHADRRVDGEVPAGPHPGRGPGTLHRHAC